MGKRWYREAAMVFLLTLGAASAAADPSSKKQNGDDSTDLAPLGGSRDSDKGSLAHANMPAIGAATNGAGPNPHETGPIDSEKATKFDKR